MGEFIEVANSDWVLIRPLLPAERRPGCRPAQDNHRYFERIMWLARTGSQWPPSLGHGMSNCVFRRFRRWDETGLSDALLEARAELVERDANADMIGSRNSDHASSSKCHF